MPLYDILNEFQKGSSHMAAVVKAKGKNKTFPPGEKTEESKTGGDSQLTAPLLSSKNAKSESVVVDIDRNPRTASSTRLINGVSHMSEDIEDGEVIGIITLEDVFEELLQVIRGFISHPRVYACLICCQSSFTDFPEQRRRRS